MALGQRSLVPSSAQEHMARFLKLTLQLQIACILIVDGLRHTRIVPGQNDASQKFSPASGTSVTGQSGVIDHIVVSGRP